MNGKRRKSHWSVGLEPAGEGETASGSSPRAEPSAAKPASKSLASAEQLMEEACSRENLEAAWKRARKDKGSPGVDGMTIDAAKGYLREQWPNIRSQLLGGTYQPLQRFPNAATASGRDAPPIKQSPRPNAIMRRATAS